MEHSSELVVRHERARGKANGKAENELGELTGVEIRLISEVERSKPTL